MHTIYKPSYSTKIVIVVPKQTDSVIDAYTYANNVKTKQRNNKEKLEKVNKL